MNIAKIDDNYQLDEIKKEIDKSVVELTDKLKKHNPMELIYHIKSMEMIPTVSENDPGVMLFKTDNEYAIMIEYFISLLTCITFDQFGNENIENGDINEIINAYHHIQTEIYQYLILTINTPEYKEKHTDDETDYIINRFLFSNVRGKRYRCFERDYYNVLLLPHEKEIERIYQININDFYDGMFQIMDISLGSFLDAMNILDDVFEKYDNPEDVPFEIRKEFSKSLTIEQYKIDPTKIWNKEMLDDFSLSFGGNSLFDNGKYARWPINNSLLKQKPIIKVENDYFCFNYYNLADNFYRMLYKNLIHNDKKYAQKWQEIQKFSTENYVSKLFKMIFNDAKIYNDNYYFPNGVKRERSENDILVIFDDVLFIVEVKAGNFTPDNSLVGYESHKKTIKALVEEPDRQCMEIYEYLQNNKKIYDENNLEKVEIELDKFDEVYMISITLENFNEIASIIEKFENIKFTKGNILISIDDFRIYADYFENNPYLFLDYLKYRKKAMEFIELNVTDELDHLGLYIDYHNYIYEIKSQIKNQQNQEFNIVYVDDAKNDLDLYYDSKQTPEIIGKPLPLWIDDNYKKLLLLIQKRNVSISMNLLIHY